MPTWSMHWATLAGVRSRLTPRVSTTSADPQRLETERFPCLATLSPAPATTNAVAVETLNVPDASPPVPAVSMSISRSVPASAVPTSPRVRTRTALSRMTSAKPDQLLDGLPLHPERGEEGRDLDGGGGAGHEGLHGGGRLEPRQVAPLHQRPDGFHDDGTGHESSPPIRIRRPHGSSRRPPGRPRTGRAWSSRGRRRASAARPAGTSTPQPVTRIDRHLGPDGLHGLRHLPAGHAGHGQVGHHQVERRPPGTGPAPRRRRRPPRPRGAAGGECPPACPGRTARRR